MSDVTVRNRLGRVGVALALFGVLGTAIIVGVVGVRSIGVEVWRAFPALPAALAVHLTQLALAGLAWRALFAAPRPARWAMVRARLIREAANTLLPFAGVGSGVVGVQELARCCGVSASEGAASVTADLTTEALSQVPFLVASLALVAMAAPGLLSPLAVVAIAVPITTGAVAFVAVQRAGLLRVIERLARRVGFGEAADGMHAALMRIHAAPGRVAWALALHFAAWVLGAAEVWVVLRTVGQPVGWSAAFAIEGVGMAARSAGFALPAGLAAQEAGFVLVAAAFGVGGPEAVALSMLKRLRELVVAGLGVALFRPDFRGVLAPDKG